jgi:hypothetical protein
MFASEFVCVHVLRDRPRRSLKPGNPWIVRVTCVGECRALRWTSARVERGGWQGMKRFIRRSFSTKIDLPYSFPMLAPVPVTVNNHVTRRKRHTTPTDHSTHVHKNSSDEVCLRDIILTEFCDIPSFLSLPLGSKEARRVRRVGSKETRRKWRLNCRKQSPVKFQKNIQK